MPPVLFSLISERHQLFKGKSQNWISTKNRSLFCTSVPIIIYSSRAYQANLHLLPKFPTYRMQRAKKHTRATRRSDDDSSPLHSEKSLIKFVSKHYTSSCVYQVLANIEKFFILFNLITDIITFFVHHNVFRIRTQRLSSQMIQTNLLQFFLKRARRVNRSGQKKKK